MNDTVKCNIHVDITCFKLNLLTVINFLQEEMTRKVLVRGRDVKIKALVLKDKSAKCKVFLWRDLSCTPVSVGQHVRITDVVVQSYNNDKSLSTTSRTQIEVNIHFFAKINRRN